MKPTLILLFASTIALSVALSIIRDSGYGGPHHDEVIALLAAGAKEGDFAQMLAHGTSPLHQIVPASEWHRYTHAFKRLQFSAIRFDIMHGDKHPPLAFWLMNRWLSLFSNGGYSQAILLVWFQIVIAAVVLAAVVHRYTSRPDMALLAFAVFLLGNSAIVTGIWVRQYGLFVLCYAGLMAVSGELLRRRISGVRTATLATLLAMLCLAGMMTQYTFATMSLPIHVVLAGMLAVQRRWRRMAVLVVAYGISGTLFLWLMPGVIEHAAAVSKDQNVKWQIHDALVGVPYMYIPLPSSLPPWLMKVAGVVAMILPGAFAWGVFRSYGTGADDGRPDARVPISGMLGAGLLQFVMVACGYFPGWATAPNHMCAFWLLTVLAFVLSVARWQWTRLLRLGVAMGFLGMVGMQFLYAWHCHRILPRLNTAYILSENPDLVCIDNLSRGFVLQITDVVPPERRVLATQSQELAERLQHDSLPDRILYLPMDTTVKNGKASVIAAAQQVGYVVKELPVVHTGMYEAVLLERRVR